MQFSLLSGEIVDFENTSGVREIFHHTDVDETERYFCVPKLLQMIRLHPEDWKLTTFPIDRIQAAYVIKNRGIEEARVKAYPLAKLDEPGVGCLFPDGSLLTVDGNHRLVKRVRRGLTSMEFWTAPEPVWRRALVDPKHLILMR